ncbi:MAG TPA: hypothetical protein VF794_28365 [Archangium sp.]|jgi:hypothetical protein|uniref:hypothetical protein n=1 Tax=Archangium sp. TaxID=1872627 RepID=UPI002ED89ED6
MKPGAKMAWLAVVVVGVVTGSGAVLFRQNLGVNPPLAPLGLILVQMAALLLPLYRSRELRVEVREQPSGRRTPR